MKNPLLRLLVLALLLAPLCVHAAHSPGQLIMRVTSAPSRALDGTLVTGIPAIDGLVQTDRAQVVQTLAEFSRAFPIMESVVTLSFDETINLDSLEAVIAASASVQWVTRNYLYRTNNIFNGGIIPDDSLFSQQWWLQRIQAPLAWDITRGDTTIIIGVIDTGVDYLHPDLAANIWINWADADSNGVDDDNNGFIDDKYGWDFVDAPTLPAPGDHLVRDNDPMDELGHGTYVSGLASASTDNDLCYASVGYNCRIMCLRAGNSQGYLEEDDIAAAMLYGAANGASVLNMSFGDNVSSPLLRETVLLAHEAGVVLVASAGNQSSGAIHYPSGYAEVIGVGATDEFDRRASGFSNYGPTVDVVAPGHLLSSTMLNGECGQWIYPSGTSYAAPLVSGIAGLILSVNPQLSPADVAQVIASTSDDIRPIGWDEFTAHGRVNARRAVEQAAYGADVVARITSPGIDQGLTTSFPVIGEAWGAAFDRYELSYGLGENPTAWTLVATGNERHYGDSLGWIELPPQDTVLIVRLQVFGAQGARSVAHAHTYVLRSAPVIDSISVMRMLNYDSYGDLVQVRASQVTTASFILTNERGDSVRQDFGYVSRRHAGLLSQDNHPGAWTVRIRLENPAGLSAISAPFPFAINEPPFATNVWQRTTLDVPNGLMSPFTTDYDCDNRREVWLQRKQGEYYVGDLEPHEWNGTTLVPSGSTYGVGIPRATGDADGDGLIEVMTGFSRTTRIWEQSQSCGVPDNLVLSDTTGFFGAAFVRMDSTSNRAALLAHVPTDNSLSRRPRFVLFSVDGEDYRLTPLDTLPNLTAGENVLGPPHVLVGDLDGDGMLDFLYGDYDGDIVFCESGPSGVEQRWTTRLPINDATSWFAGGDFDGDGQLELVAGCRSNALGGSESQRQSLHWQYFFFERTGDNEFSRVDSVFIYGNESVSIHPASVTAADIDADGRADVLISAYPDFYIVSYNPASGRYVPRWYYTPSESNTSLVVDWNGDGVNEFIMADGVTLLRVEAASAAGQRPLPPLNLQGEPLDAHTVALSWRSVAGADSYRVYRATAVPEFVRWASAADTFTILSGLPEDAPFTYAVATVSMAFPIDESVLSNYVTLAANAPPAVEDTAAFIEPRFVQLRFSEPMGESAIRQWSYRLDGLFMPDIISPGENGRIIHLSFSDGLTPGWHRLDLSNLRDAQNSRLPAEESPVHFEVRFDSVARPHVVSHRVIGMPSASLIEVVYSQPMSISAIDPANYRLVSPRRVIDVRDLSDDHSRVQVQLDPGYPVGALDMPARMQIRNLTSAVGIPMDTSAGRADLLLGGAAANIAGIFVYPNPYKGIGPNREESIVFAGLPPEAIIRIFTIQGTLVRRIEHSGATGATRWNLQNEDGQVVAAGVYLYSAESNGETVRGKFAILK